MSALFSSASAAAWSASDEVWSTSEAVWSAYEKTSGRTREISKVEEIVVTGKVEEHDSKPQMKVWDVEQIHKVRP